MSNSLGVSAQGAVLIEAYEKAGERRRAAEHEQISARNEVTATGRALVEWLLPKDAKPGETIGVWVRDHHGNERLYQATKSASPESSDPIIVVRGARQGV